MRLSTSLLSLAAVAGLAMGAQAQHPIQDANPNPTATGNAVSPQPHGGPGGRALGDVIAGPYDVETPTGDIRCLGVNQYGGSYWVTGSDSDDPIFTGQKIYQFDLNGNFIAEFVQTTTSAFWGHRDLADNETDGGTTMYAGNESGELNVYDMSGGTPVWSNAIAVATSQNVRGLAKQVGGNFFSGDFSSSVIEFDGAGVIVNTYANPGTAVYGACWDTTNSTLWLHGQDDNGFGNSNHMSEYTVGGGVLTPTGREFWHQSSSGGGIAGGADFYNDARNPDGDTIVGLSQDTPDNIVASNAVGTTPPPPPVQWVVNLPTGAPVPALDTCEGFEAYGGTVPAHMAVSELDAATGLFDPEAWCNIGQRGPTMGGASGNPPWMGTYALEMGLDPASSNYHNVRNALVIAYNGEGSTDQMMEFYAYDHGEESNGIDGAWVSNDGLNWDRVWSDWNALTLGAWENVTAVDLANAPNVDTSGDYFLMFGQEDNFPLGNLDGVQADEICITGTPGTGCNLTLAMRGTCPGQVTFSGSGATPGGMVCCLAAMGPGSAAIPAGVQCAGTVMGLDQTFFLAGITFADSQGNYSTTAFMGSQWCGMYGQVIDFNSCCTSNVIQL